MENGFKELGSEFWAYPALAAADNGLFPRDTLWLGAGRQALSLIVQDIRLTRRFRTVGVPSWCCHSMLEPFLAADVVPVFYDVSPAEGGGLLREWPGSGEVDGVLVLDYFGYAESEPVPEGMGVVIRDLTHGIFTHVPDDADYCFGSLRKWGAFATGGFVWKSGGRLSNPALSPDTEYIRMRRDAFSRKTAFIEGRTDDKSYLDIFSAAEESLSPLPVRAGDPADADAARRVDPAILRECRRQNAETLLESVLEMAIFPRLSTEDCPLFVPILVPDGKRDALRRYLIQNRVYLPVHWPLSAAHRSGGPASVIYENELSLVCDQRYTPVEMRRVDALIETFLREGEA